MNSKCVSLVSKVPPGFHTACSNPDIDDWNLSPLLHEGVVNDSVLPRNMLIDGDDFHLELIDDREQLLFVEVPSTSFHEALAELPQNNGWHKELLAQGCQYINHLQQSFSKIAVYIHVQDELQAQSPLWIS